MNSRRDGTATCHLNGRIASLIRQGRRHPFEGYVNSSSLLFSTPPEPCERHVVPRKKRTRRPLTQPMQQQQQHLGSPIYTTGAFKVGAILNLNCSSIDLVRHIAFSTLVTPIYTRWWHFAELWSPSPPNTPVTYCFNRVEREYRFLSYSFARVGPPARKRSIQQTAPMVSFSPVAMIRSLL